MGVFLPIQNDNADTNQLSEESDSSEETDDDFIVSDSDSVSGEDGADPLIYPEEEYELSAHQNMDHQQVCGCQLLPSVHLMVHCWTKLQGLSLLRSNGTFVDAKIFFIDCCKACCSM